MNFNWYLFGISLISSCNIRSCSSTVSYIVKLNAVTSFQELEQYYRQLRESNCSSSSHPPEISTSIKSELCRNIFSSSYFEGSNLVNPEEERQNLKENYEDTFNAIFSVETKASIFRVSYRHKYTNNSQSFTVVAAGNEYNEEVFSCLVRERQSPQQIKRYFVSATEYDVTETGKYYVIGRFVFIQENDHLVVHALAEEPARTFKEVIINKNEIHYLLRRLVESPVQNSEDDLVCKLSPFKKLRLCTSVLTGLQLKWTEHEVKFYPDLNNVEIECRRKEVLILTASLDSTTDTFDEWMIGCKATEDNDPTTYYISQGYDDNKAFVFKLIEHDKVEVHHYSRRAAVIVTVPEPDENPYFNFEESSA